MASIIADIKEYSKKILHYMIILWFAGAIYGALVVTAELTVAIMQIMSGDDTYGMTITVHLPELLTYIGAPVGGGIIGYMCKSAWENREKIKQSFTKIERETIESEDIP